MLGKINFSNRTGKAGIEPDNVSNIVVKAENGKVTITWKDPEDKIIDKQIVTQWKGTKLIYKAGSLPNSEKDGIQILDNQEKDKYSIKGFEIVGLTNGTKYYFALFPYSANGAINTNADNIVSATPSACRIMTAIIDLSNSNPETAVTYADDAVGMTPKSDAWDEFFGHYPCLFKEGQEVGKLNKNNFAQFEDGSTADITSGEEGDVMIAFPRRGLKIETIDNKLYVSMTDAQDSEEFKYYAHTRGETRKEKFYLGAYEGYITNNRLRSLSGKTRNVNVDFTYYRIRAQENGAGYEQSAFYQLIYRQAMYILKYKNLNSQSTIGMAIYQVLLHR